MALRSRPAAGEKGYFFVEVLVSLAILAVALVGLVPMFYFAARQNAVSSDITLAATFAHDRAEALRAQEFDSLVSGKTEETLWAGSVRFERTSIVEVDVPQLGMKTLTVKVAPVRSDGGRLRSAVVRFYRAQ